MVSFSSSRCGRWSVKGRPGRGAAKGRQSPLSVRNPRTRVKGARPVRRDGPRSVVWLVKLDLPALLDGARKRSPSGTTSPISRRPRKRRSGAERLAGHRADDPRRLPTKSRRNALQRIVQAASSNGLPLGAWPNVRKSSTSSISASPACRPRNDLDLLFDDVRFFTAPLQLKLESCDLADVWREAWSQSSSVRTLRVGHLHDDHLNGSARTDRICVVDRFPFLRSGIS